MLFKGLFVIYVNYIYLSLAEAIGGLLIFPGRISLRAIGNDLIKLVISIFYNRSHSIYYRSILISVIGIALYINF